jgi:hypothetical protein
VKRRSIARAASLVVAIACASVPVGRAAQAPGAIFRVFLKSGEALPSYGESAITPDRVVFTLIVGEAGAGDALQLVSLPAATVDVDRTRRYAMAVRAAHYASTRGDVDFAAMTSEVQRTLSQLAAIDEPSRRLALAVEARARLAAWAETTYGYRAADVRDLIGRFDELIAELGIAAGERQLTLEFRSGPMIEPEALLPAPTTEDRVRLAVAAARAADAAEDRLAILRAAEAAAVGHADAAALVRDIRDELTREREITGAYTALSADLRARADAAMRLGDATAVSAVRAELDARDRTLGGRRPGLMTGLAAELDHMLVRAHAHREALDRYARVRRSLLDYERSVRPIMSGFDGLTPIFGALKEHRYTSLDRVERASTRVRAFESGLEKIAAPEDLADVHATLVSALRMAGYACARRRLATATRKPGFDDEASAAAAGAMLLVETARDQLVARLYPPTFR